MPLVLPILFVLLLSSVLTEAAAPKTPTVDGAVTAGKPVIVFPTHNGQLHREGAAYVTAAGEPCTDPVNCYEIPEAMEYCPVEQPCSAESSSSAGSPPDAHPAAADVDKAFELAKSEMARHSNACVEIIVIEGIPRCVIRASPSKRASGCAYRVLAVDG